ncbi:ATP-binding protein [uncultured Mailhella sp.]|uniref:sensor histidine kinase n=1 Tax=uncultured Mailhella sp. TaxID=1981031 RepID=UPI0025EB0F56|nr:ATP-binding protein [uncultured Mailhella sp.]
MDDASQNSAENKLPFNLAKFFSYISLVLILISSVILTLFIGSTMNRSMLESQQEYALLLADNINRQIFRKFTLPVTYASGRVALSNPAQYKLLDEVIQSQLHGLQLESVRLFDDHYTILYSTDPKEVRRTDMYTAGIPLVFEGKPHHFDVLSSIPYAQALITPNLEKGTFLLRTIFPLTVDSDFQGLRLHGQPVPVLGVLEIVQDMTPQYRGTIRSQWLIITGFLISTLILFFLLHFVARKAEYTLSRRMAMNRQLEAQLHQAEKLASMGRMVASIAHEIRNPLGIIRSSSEFLIRRHKIEDATTQAMLSAIYDESCRLGTTVNDFLDYARPRQPRQDVVSLQDLINKAMAFLGGEFQRQGVEVHINVAPDITVLGDADLLYRAFYNILANAQQAMQGKGEIFIDSVLSTDGRTVLTFRDTGPGFSEDSLSKAMDPFFTTKDNGTGLGLPIVQAIIDSHGGSMKLANAPQGGAFITISFPTRQPSEEQGQKHE